MTRSSTRLAIVGGVVLLVACAIALAQHDARKRSRTALNSQSEGPEVAQPVEVDEDWQRHSERMLVRANNDESPGSDDNPLRSDASGAMHAVYTGVEDEPRATLAAAEGSTSLPSWLNDGPNAGANAGSPPPMPALPNGLPSTGSLSDSGDYPSTQPAVADAQPGLSGLPSLQDPGLPAPNLGGMPAAPASQSCSDALPATGNLPAVSQSLPQTAASGLDNLPTSNSYSTQPQPTAGSTNGRALGSYDQSYQDTQANIANEQSRPSATINVSGGYAPTTSFSDTQRPPQRATDLTQNHAQGGASTAVPATSNAGIGPRYQPQTITQGQSYGSNNPPQQAAPRSTLTNSQQNISSTPSSSAFAGQAQLPNNTYSQNQTAQASYSSGAVDNTGRLVSNRPGDRYLNGSQNPALIIERRSPDEIQVGKKATFILTVRNAGNATAHNVTVLDYVPKGAQFVSSVPNIRPGDNGMLSWQLGEIVAGDERSITLQLIPKVQGELGSTASVHFATQASVRTVAVQPKIEILLETNPTVLIQDNQQINVTLRNSGTGVAKGVRLEADIPQQLRHESGDAQLEAVLGDVAPNETKRISLSTKAIAAGLAECVVRAVNADGIQAEHRAPVEVKAPQLAAAIEGPKIRYLERQATFNLAVKNIGTADASELEFVAHLPTGLKFNAANNRGSYDPQTHTVTWAILGDLPAGRVAPMQLTVMPVDLGNQAIKLTAKGRLGIAADAKTELRVEGLAELDFSIGQDNGTIEVGTTSTYSVQLKNVGNKPDKNVQVVVELPAGTELVDVSAPVEYRINGQQLVFAAVPEMRNKDPYNYKFQVRHNQAGSQVVRAKVTSANWPVAVVKEEGTLVYNDQTE